jgi:hypothetical protein
VGTAAGPCTACAEAWADASGDGALDPLALGPADAGGLTVDGWLVECPAAGLLAGPGDEQPAAVAMAPAALMTPAARQNR